MNRFSGRHSKPARCRMAGFTLLELSLVLLVVGLLTSQLLKPFGGLRQSHLESATQQQLESAREELLGFAMTRLRLPCPATESSAGFEVSDCGGRASVGYLPAATLGIQGSTDAQGRLLDAWGQPIRYAVSGSDSPDAGSVGQPDYTSAGELSSIGFRYLQPDLVVCHRLIGNRCQGQDIRANQLPVVIWSIGKDAGGGNDQQGNLDHDNYFVSKPLSQNGLHSFDDQLIWISESRLNYELAKAGLAVLQTPVSRQNTSDSTSWRKE